MKYTTFIFYIIVLSSVINSSCYPERLEASYYLTDEEKAYIPFKGGERITYIKAGINDPIVFTVNPINAEILEASPGVNTNSYYEYETMEASLLSSNFEISFFLSANDKYYHYKPRLTINWYNDLDGFPGVEGHERVPMDTNDYHADVILLDSLQVLDSTYYKVFKGNLRPFVLHDSVYEPPFYPVSYYYKLHLGVIRFDFSDSTIWQLENIEW